MTDDEKRELIAEAREWRKKQLPKSPFGDGHVVNRLADALEGTLTEPDAAGVLQPEWVDGYGAGFADGAQWAVERLPSRDEIADAMIAGNPDYKVTLVTEGERDWYLRDADAVLALIRKRFEESK